MLLVRCSSKETSADFTYIKVITVTPADSITIYNKGFTTGTYLYYEPQKDSIFYYFPLGDAPSDEKAYVGQLRNKAYVDSLRQLVAVLRRFGNGSLPASPAGGNSTSDGAQYYVEYKDSDGVHRLAFNTAEAVSDTLNQFDRFYGRLVNLSWHRQEVKSSIIHKDSELVILASAVGHYQKLVTPYIVGLCNGGIDLTKLYGVWRSGYWSHREEKYTRWTFQKDGWCIWEQVANGLTKKAVTYRFTQQGQSFNLLSKGAVRTYEIINLSQSCFEFKNQEEGVVHRYGPL